MRLIFAGTPEFARVALQRLCESGHDVVLVLTQPDRPAGRGMRLQASAVKQYALEHGIALCQPRSLRLDGKYGADAHQARDAIGGARADAMVVAAYGLILPQWVLDAMREGVNGKGSGLGCLNIHASLLPRWRGAAPIHRAIEAGDAKTGVCIMQMDAGLDTGAVLLQQELPIRQQGPDADTTGSLHDRLAAVGADLIARTLEMAAQRPLVAEAQAADGVCYAAKVEKAQARIDWQASAEQIERRIRAFNPAPGAWTLLGADLLKIWRARVESAGAGAQPDPGTVLALDNEGIDLACGSGVLRLLEVQRAGGRRMAAGELVRALSLRPGARLGDDPPAAA